MAKIYSKNTHVDEVLVGDEIYNIKDSEGAIIHGDVVIELASTVAVAGTAENAEVMNNIEEGIDDLDDLLDTVNTQVNTNGVPKVRETGGPAVLTVGAIPDGSILVRSGTGLVGKTVSEMQVLLNPYALIGGVLHKQLFIGGWKPTVTNPCADPVPLEMPTNKNVYDVCYFDKDTDEFARASLPLPQDYTGGVVYAQPYWTHPAAAAYKVSWALQGVAIADDGTLDVAQGTAQVSLDEGGTTYDLYIGPLTSAITIAGTPAAGKLVNWRTYRDANDATNDTLGVDAGLIGWIVWYPVR